MEIDFASLSPWLLVVVPAAVIAAYVVLGLSGFGSTMITVRSSRISSRSPSWSR